MEKFLCSLGVLVLMVLVAGTEAGHDGVVTPDILHHVAKVLSHGYGTKVVLSYPEKAHLVDYGHTIHSDPYYGHGYHNHHGGRGHLGHYGHGLGHGHHHQHGHIGHYGHGLGHGHHHQHGHLGHYGHGVGHGHHPQHGHLGHYSGGHQGYGHY